MFKRLFNKNAKVLTAEEEEEKMADLRLAMALTGYVPPPPKVVFSKAEITLAEREREQAMKNGTFPENWSNLKIAVDENLNFLFKYSLATEKHKCEKRKCQQHKFENRTYYLADAMVHAAELGRCDMLELLVRDYHYVNLPVKVRTEVFQGYAAAGVRSAWRPMEALLLEQAMKKQWEIVGQKGQVEINLRNAIENRESSRIELLISYYAMFYDMNDFKGAERVFLRDNETKKYNVDDIKPFLMHGLDISGFKYIRSGRGYPADIIFMACEEDDDPLLHFFLHYNVSPNATGSYRLSEEWSPLHECAVKGFTKSVALLLERGADANRRSRTGETPLLNLVETLTGALKFSNKHLEIAKMLIEHGADVDARNEPSGWTTYARALFIGQHDLVDLLVASGARTDLNGPDGETVQEHLKRLRELEERRQAERKRPEKVVSADE